MNERTKIQARSRQRHGKEGEGGFVLLATTMVAVILALVSAGMIRESGSSNTSARIFEKSITLEEAAKACQVIAAQLAVRGRNNINLNSTTTGLARLWISDLPGFRDSLDTANNTIGSLVDQARTGNQPYAVLGSLTCYMDMDWQGSYEAEKSSSALSYIDSDNWSVFGNVNQGGGASNVGTSGSLQDSEKANHNYELYTLNILIQQTTVDGTGNPVVPQTLDPTLPFSELKSAYKYDYTRTPPQDF